MDAQKYKKVAGSMKNAFGVQTQIKASESPKGTSIIAQEFSPGRPDPTVLNEVRQHTVDDMANTLHVLCTPGESDAREDENKGSKDSKEISEAAAKQAMEKIKQKLEAKTQADAVKAAAKLMDEIRKGRIEVETQGREIVIRVKEKGSFESGSAKLQDSFIPIMDKIRGAIENIKGVYAVAGHTDDIPISTIRFRSNWELSSARSVSVAHELLKAGTMPPELFTIVGHGDTKPLVENDSADNRSLNRRVEIIINQGENDEKIISGEEALPEDEEFTEDLLREAGLEGVEGFEILMGEDEEEGEASEDDEIEDEEREISAFEPVPDDLRVPEEVPSGEEFGEFDDLDVVGGDVEAAIAEAELDTPPVESTPTVPESNTSPENNNDAFDISVDPFSQPSTSPSDEGSEFF